MKKLVLIVTVFGLVATASMMTSCSKSEETKKTLYDSLGGTTMVDDPAFPGTKIEQGRLNIRSVVDSTIFVVAADASLNTKFFSVLLGEVTSTPAVTTGLTNLSKNFTDFMCVAAGAKNFTYGGKNMVDAHNPATNSRIGAKINSTEFDKFVADLVIGATKCGVSTQLIGQVGVLINTTKTSVVQM